MTRLTRRRLLLSAGALLLPAAARAQPAGRVYRLVYLATFPPQSGRRYTDFLKEALRERGFVEGRNLVFEHRHANGKTERLPEVARQVVREAPDVIVTAINSQTRAVQQATGSIPIVMVVGTDVIQEGLVASLARPGGNITGATWDATGSEVTVKRIEFLKVLLPGLSRIAGLLDTGQDAIAGSEMLKEGAAAAGLEAIWLESQEDLEPLFATAARSGAQALLTGGGTRLFHWRRQVVELAAKYRLPDAHYDSAFVHAGGLMSYAPSLAGLFAKAGDFVARILRGADPAALPVEQPTKFELVINLGTARTLGLDIPQSLLLRADRLVGKPG
jgi:putative ABC transport system substrate-binding protein